MRLLLVEDDAMLGRAVHTALTQQNHAVDWVRDGEQALQAALTHDYQAVLLDLGLPQRDGLSVLRALRAQRSDTPVLIVTARDRIEQRIEGLKAGADDYILKPFDLDELDARLHAVTRRAQGRSSNCLHVGPVEVDTDARCVKLHGASVELTAKEYATLVILMQRCGRIVSRSEVEDAVYAWGAEVGSNTVEVYIHNLRRKLGRHFIRTQRGLGYSVVDVT
jgi:DNA-binding response OmpR family regulator